MMKNVLLRHIGIICLFFLLSAFNTYPLIFSLKSHILNYTPYPWQHDWWFNSWLVDHGTAILRSILSGAYYFDDVFYPLGTPTSLYGQILFATIVSQPFLHFLTLPIVVNLLTIIFLAACGYTTYLLARHLLNSSFYALAAGCIFCSSPILIAQAKSHFVVLSTIFAIPLYILYLIKTTEQPNYKHSIFLWLSATVLSAGYLYFLNMLFIFTVIFIFREIIRNNIHLIQIKYYFIALLLFLPSILFIFFFLFPHSGFSIGSSLSQVRHESVDLLAFILPDVDHPVFGALSNEIRRYFINNPILHSVYIGIPILYFSGWCIKFNHRTMKFWILLAFLFTILSLGPVIHIFGKELFSGQPQESGYLPYIVYYFLFKPFVVSDCSMFFILAMLFWAILASSGICLLLSKFNHKVKLIFFYSILCLIFFDYLSIPHPTLNIPDPSTLKVIHDDIEDASILFLPYKSDMIYYLYLQTLCGKKMLNPGYPRRIDAEVYHYGDHFPFLSRFIRPQISPHKQINPDEFNNYQNFRWFFNLKYIILLKKLFTTIDEFLATCDLIEKSLNGTPVYENDDILILNLKELNTSVSIHTFPKKLEFNDTDKNVIFYGWSYPEKDDSGRNWRWSNQNESILILKTDSPIDYIMHCSLRPFIYDPSRKQKLVLYLNNNKIADLQLDEGWKVYDIIIPKSAIHKGYNRFLFSYGYTASPLEKGISSDFRHLAVAFDAISFTDH